MTTDAYAAGLVDGEGCIYIARDARRLVYSPRVDVGMTEKALGLLRLLKATYGGSVRRTRPASERWDAAYCWTVQGKLAAAFLRQIQPSLVLKQEQARLALLTEEVRVTLPSTPSGRARWTPEAADRCSTLHRRIQELNRKGPVVPPPSPGWFARLVAGTWVSPQGDLFADLGFQTFSGTWPRSGMTRNGTAYQRPPSAPLTAATAGGALLPTPTATNYGSNQSPSTGAAVRPSLAAMARHNLWPTPTVNGNHNRAGASPTSGDGLSTAVNRWPTPAAHLGDPKRGMPSPGLAARRLADGRRNLEDSVTAAGPDPTSATSGPPLNPEWVELLQGFPIGWTEVD